MGKKQNIYENLENEFKKRGGFGFMEDMISQLQKSQKEFEKVFSTEQNKAIKTSQTNIDGTKAVIGVMSEVEAPYKVVVWCDTKENRDKIFASIENFPTRKKTFIQRIKKLFK